MSHHILQQFDEQWLMEIERGDALPEDRDLLWKSALGQSEHSSRRWLTMRAPRQWVVLAAALVIAGVALLLAYDAGRRADDLQRRLSAYEMASGK